MKKTVFVFLVLFFVMSIGASVSYAEEFDPAEFDGGSGSTLNEGPGDYGGSVPDVGPSGPVGVATDEQGNNYSY